MYQSVLNLVVGGGGIDDHHLPAFNTCMPHQYFILVLIYDRYKKNDVFSLYQLIDKEIGLHICKKYRYKSVISFYTRQRSAFSLNLRRKDKMNHEYSYDTGFFFYHMFSFVFIEIYGNFFFLLRQWPGHGQYVINDGCFIWPCICKRALDLRATEHGFPPRSEQTICDEQTTFK